MIVEILINFRVSSKWLLSNGWLMAVSIWDAWINRESHQRLFDIKSHRISSIKSAYQEESRIGRLWKSFSQWFAVHLSYSDICRAAIFTRRFSLVNMKKQWEWNLQHHRRRSLGKKSKLIRNWNTCSIYAENSHVRSVVEKQESNARILIADESSFVDLFVLLLIFLPPPPPPSLYATSFDRLKEKHDKFQCVIEHGLVEIFFFF